MEFHPPKRYYLSFLQTIERTFPMQITREGCECKSRECVLKLVHFHFQRQSNKNTNLDVD
ncbi:hypothetical protein PHET_09803 [Paragonimus heterotremus]|uniref:Uncharacterized protein n=1 Tax=Paragonimus heterotremus TaxID=100268 RepID=A0A8J4T2J8_9TREM|nr:hypothetical protein PHET_09803 [Paragonimus heterotremus]